MEATELEEIEEEEDRGGEEPGAADAGWDVGNVCARRATNLDVGSWESREETSVGRSMNGR